ncbi:MAG: hypothetical protein JHC31_05260 [Sulfurihydrogenibium sp.]|jgi:hypothetical protein|nr:hypothetical protein [Sulfurihydrogenibium sp.]
MAKVIEIIHIKMPDEDGIPTHMIKTIIGSTEFITKAKAKKGKDPVGIPLGKNIVKFNIEYSCLQCRAVIEQISEEKITVDIYRCKTKIDRVEIPLNTRKYIESGGITIEYTKM